MEIDDVDSFCPYCGRRYEGENDYCPECGKQIVNVSFEERVKIAERRKSMIRLNWSVVLLGVFSLFSIIGAIVAFVTIGLSPNPARLIGAEISPNGIEVVKGLSQFQYLESVKLHAIVCVITGVFALISLYCCFKRIHFNIALGACIATSLGLIVQFFFMNGQIILGSLVRSLVQIMIGFIVASMIYKSRDQFIDSDVVKSA